MSNVKVDPIPPVPEHTPPLKGDELDRVKGKFFNQVWTRWFVSLRDKINVINESMVNLGDVSGSGIIAKDGAAWVPREIKGTTGRIDVTNGDGVAGDPTITIPDSGVVAGSYTNVDVTVGADGRITAISNGTVVHGIPAGGTTGQILAKVSGTDYDVAWVDP